MKRISSRLLHLPLALAAATFCGAAVPAGATEFKGDYTVTYLGLPVAQSSLRSRIDGKDYTIEGTVRSAGLGAIFDDTQATLDVRGQLSGGGAVPARAHSDYRQNKKKKTLTISFSGGNVVGTQETPPPKPRAADWIAVSPSQLRSVADPLSALLVRADSIDKVCAKPLRMFDGAMRADLVLDRQKQETVKLSGYEGPSITCNARFSPLAGYRASKKSVKFMRDKSRISITFAPLGTTGVYAPVRASVGTQIGTLYLEARHVEMID
ncbi:MAG: DUF3108 domain-containing protein [Rhizobiales bacterium]|nr:DUF3108 domain-containing protein [Hyphomicrobiales bacterium]